VNVKLSRWVFLVLCGLLSIVLVVPVRSEGGNLVYNGDFSEVTPFDGWVRVSGGQATLHDLFPCVDGSPCLTSGESREMSYSQCVDTSVITSGVDVGGSIYTRHFAAGNIVFTLYTDDACTVTSPGAGATLVPTAVSEWISGTAQIDLPDSGGTYVKVTLNIFVPTSTYEPTYFDDIFVQETDPTGVLLVEPAMQARESAALVPTLIIAVAVFGLARVLGRRKVIGG